MKLLDHLIIENAYSRYITEYNTRLKISSTEDTLRDVSIRVALMTIQFQGGSTSDERRLIYKDIAAYTDARIATSASYTQKSEQRKFLIRIAFGDAYRSPENYDAVKQLQSIKVFFEHYKKPTVLASRTQRQLAVNDPNVSLKKHLKTLFETTNDYTFIDILTALNNGTTHETWIFQSTHPLVIANLYRNIFIYCDIVLPSYVGNVYTKLLRIADIPYSAVYGEHINKSFEKLYYLPLAAHEFQAITINIKDEYDKLVAFEFGTAIVTLHFRRRK